MKRKHRKFLNIRHGCGRGWGIGNRDAHPDEPVGAGFRRDDARHRDNRGRKLQREAISDSGTGEQQRRCRARILCVRAGAIREALHLAVSGFQRPATDHAFFQSGRRSAKTAYSKAPTGVCNECPSKCRW